MSRIDLEWNDKGGVDQVDHPDGKFMVSDRPVEKEEILHITLSKKWFDMILSGEKLEEYRGIKDYWARRLLSVRNEMEFDVWQELIGDISSLPRRHDSFQELLDFFNVKVRQYRKIVAVNGYGAHRPSFIADFISLEVGIGKKEWGAPDYPVFIIKLSNTVLRNGFTEADRLALNNLKNG